MEQPGGGVAIVTGMEAERPENSLQGGDVGRELMRPDRGVFDPGDRLGVSFAAGEQRNARLAEIPHEIGLSRVLQDLGADPETPGGDSGQALGHRLVEEFHDEDALGRPGVELEQIARGAEGELPARLVGEHAIDVLHGGGLEIEQLHRRLHRVRDGMEIEERHTPFARNGDDVEFGGEDGGKSSLASREQRSRVHPVAQETVEPVTRPALEQVGRHSVCHQPRSRLNQRREPNPLGSKTRRTLQRPDTAPEDLDASIGQQDFQRPHVIRGGAVDGNVGPGAVVGDHPAQGCAGAGGDVGAEAEPVRLEERVQRVEDDPGPDPHRAPFEVEPGDPPVVARELEDKPGAERAPDQPGSRAARSQLETGVARRAHDRLRLAGVPWKGHRDGLDLMARRVGGIELARERIVPHLTPGKLAK